MKKFLTAVIIIIVSVVLFSGCGESRNEISSKKANDFSMSDKNSNHIDIDLTVLSSTMVYAEVYRLMTEPEKYEGKIIKMNGLYYANSYEPTVYSYHFIVIPDATSCCAQGLEFIWLGEHSYPDDYPEDGTEIEITGKFDGYDDDGNTFYRISTNAIKVL